MVKVNAYMNIQVRVLSASAAAQIKALQAQINGLGGAMGKVSGAGYVIGARQIAGLTKFGNQIQWTGRQLEYNFTLPILAAGGAAAKFALDNETAFTRVAKVYGDATMSSATMRNELNALKGAFEALSNEYGVQQKEVIGIAADWAAAGASGVALARGVEETLKVMVLGELSAADATQALISIQAQYNLSSAQLVDTIAKLNVVENQTAISMQGLIAGFQRSAGVARSAGVDVDHLAAFLAALVPAAGSAAQAGNALKTIISRIMSPTKKAADVMKAMGININSIAWTSANGTQRLELLATKFHGLADSQKTTVATTIASQYQLNKFEILMDQIYKSLNNSTRAQSRYGQALDATKDRANYLKQAQKELDQVLQSNPQKLKQIWVILQNALADVIQPLIPYLILAANMVRRMVESFRNLPPVVQKAVVVFLLFLALFGPLLRYLGATMALLGEFAWVFGGIIGAVSKTAVALLSLTKIPVGILGTAIGAVGGAFLRFGGFVGTAIKALAGFVAAGPIFSKLTGFISAIMTQMGRTIVTIWMFALTRMGVVTGPALGLISKAFGLWSAGLVRTMTFVRAVLGGAWLAIIAGGRVVGPALLASFRTLFVGMAASAGAGAAYVVGSVRNMFVAMGALFTNWRSILTKGWALMWGGIVTLSRGGLVAVGRALMSAASVLIGPWGLVIAAVLALLYMFRDQIAQVVKNAIGFFQNLPPGVASAFKPLVNLFHAAVAAIQRAFNALPNGVKNALLAVVNIVAAAAHQVYELFSYLNPFAHHSPSLVENVTNGMAIVRKELASVTSVEGDIKSAYKEIKAFGVATRSLLNGMDTAQRASQRADLAKVDPKALPQFDALVKRIMQLTGELNNLKAAVDAQQSVVDGWKNKLDAANAALDTQQKKLDSLQKVLDTAKDNLSNAQDALSKFANTPIQGMKAMEDQIFANDQAQKALQLQMLKMEDAGQTYDDLNKKLDALHGQMELLTGEQKSLRDAGAGSEILSVYDKQIKSVEDQTKAVQDQQAQYSDLQSQLDKLQHTAQELDLEKSLNFDGLQRDIDAAANSMKEMPFDEIMKGIQNSNADIAKYTDQVNKANDAVVAQQKVVDQATAARDAISASYDAEAKKLDTLKGAYDDVNQAIQDINSSLSDMASAANDAIQRAKDAGKGAGGALGAAGDFPNVAGSGGLGREGGPGDQSAMIDQFTKDLANKTSDLLGGFDLFGPIKKKFSELGGWFSKNVGPVFGAIGTAAKAIFGGIDWTAPFKKIDWTFLKTIWSTIRDIWNTGVGWIRAIIALFADDFKKIWNVLVDKFKKAWNQLAPELAKFKDLLQPVAQMWKNIWTVLKPVVAVLGGVLLFALKLVSSVLANILGPALDIIIALIKGFILIVRGLAEFIAGVFTGNWKLAWQGIKDIFAGIWDAIWGVIKGAVGIIWGLIKGLVEGIWGFFKWLYDELVGHSIIPDMVNAIISWIASLPQKAWDALKDLGNKIVDIAKTAWNMFLAAVQAGWALANAFFFGIPQKAWAALSALAGKLSSRASEALNGFWNAAKAVWNAVTGWFGGWKDTILNRISNIAGTLRAVGSDILNKFRDGYNAIWGSITSFFGGWGARIRNAIGNINLYNIGKAIMQSFLDGLKKIWNDVTGFVGGIEGWFHDNKGPIEKDRKMLIPEGAAIMNSLHIGLKKEWPALQSFVKTLAPSIQDSISSGIQSATPGILKGVATGQLSATAAAASNRLTTTPAGGSTTPTTQYGNHYEYHFHGNLEFPNVHDGNDAEEFLLNLEALVKG